MRARREAQREARPQVGQRCWQLQGAGPESGDLGPRPCSPSTAAAQPRPKALGWAGQGFSGSFSDKKREAKKMEFGSVCLGFLESRRWGRFSFLPLWVLQSGGGGGLLWPPPE